MCVCSSACEGSITLFVNNELVYPAMVRIQVLQHLFVYLPFLLLANHWIRNLAGGNRGEEGWQSRITAKSSCELRLASEAKKNYQYHILSEVGKTVENQEEHVDLPAGCQEGLA